MFPSSQPRPWAHGMRIPNQWLTLHVELEDLWGQVLSLNSEELGLLAALGHLTHRP